MNDKLLGMLGLAVRAGKTVSGVFLTLKAVDEGRARVVIAATDIGSSNKRSIEFKCKDTSTPLLYYSDKASLSHAAGKTNIPCISVCDDNFSNAIIKIYGGVEK